MARAGPGPNESHPLNDFASFPAQADKARAEAKAATLENVRARCLRSAQAWDEMASRVQRVAEMRANLDAAKERERAGEPSAETRWPKPIDQ